MSSRWLIATLVAACSLHGATLERLTLDDMIAKSTAIVRGQVQASHTIIRGSIIYTSFSVRILEQFKGPRTAEIEVVTPGGSYGRLNQAFSGTPRLTPGSEFVFFLWAGRNNLNQIIGLSQGLFTVQAQGKDGAQVSREATTETMLNAAGLPVQDAPVRMSLAELRQRVRKALGE